MLGLPGAPARDSWAPLCLALLAGIVLYLPNLRLELLADDYIYLVGAQTQPMPAWLATSAGASYYRPLSRQLYFSGMNLAWGSDPLPYHVASLLLYLAAALLLARLAKRLGAPGTLAAVFFLAQHAGSVLTGWACCTQDLIALVAGLGAVLLHLSGRRWLAAPVLLAGLLSKETAAIVPFLILFLEWRGRRTPWRALLPQFATLAAWALGYLLVLRAAGPLVAGAPVMDLHLDPRALLRGLSHSLLALGNMDEGWTLRLGATDTLRLLVAATLGAAALWLGGGATTAPRPPVAPRFRGALAVGVAWTALGLLPVAMVAHRWSAYDTIMAGAGFALLLAALLERRRVLALVLGVLLLAAGPAADGVRGGDTEQDLRSTWNLARLRRLSDFSRGLKSSLEEEYPTIPSGSRLVLSYVPSMCMLALRDSLALQAWYDDASLSTQLAPAGLQNGRPDRPVVLANCDWSRKPPRWHVPSPRFRELSMESVRANVDELPHEEQRTIGGMMRMAEWHSEGPRWRADAMVRLACSHAQTGQLDSAETGFEGALALEPGDGLIVLHLGLTQIQRNDPAAGATMRRALELLPENPYAAYGYAVTLRAQDPREALAWFRRSFELGLAGESRELAARMMGEIRAERVEESLLPGNAEGQVARN